MDPPRDRPLRRGAAQHEEVVGLAAAYTNNSGIDITQKIFWGDRDRFLPALTDPGLQRFLESLN